MFLFFTILPNPPLIMKDLPWPGPMLMETAKELWKVIPKAVETLEINACENMNPKCDRNKNKKEILEMV